MKAVLKILGVILIGIGTIILLAGKSAATDALGLIILLLMGGIPAALGVYFLLKSGSKKGSGSNVPEQPTIPPMPEPGPVKIPEPEPVKAPEPDLVNEEPPAPAPEPEKPLFKKYAFKVAGISRRQKDIASKLLPENSDFLLSKSELVEIGAVDERIYKYSPIELDAELVPEPDNPRDPNAIKVLVDGVQLGYVPADKTGKVKSLLEKDQIHAITSAFYGGPYKIIHEDFDLEREKDVYTIEKDSQYNIGAEITIEYK